MGCHLLLPGSEWLDGVGQAGMYATAERMNGRTRLHTCWEGIPVNNGTRIEGVLVRIGSRGQDTKCVAISCTSGLGRTTKRWGGYPSHTWRLLYMSDKRLLLLWSERVCQPRWEMSRVGKKSWFFKIKQEGQHPLTGQRAPPISGGT